MTKHYRRIVLMVVMPWVLALMSCGPKHDVAAGHGHGEESEEGHGEHAAEAEGASYAEGNGISLSEETEKSLGLKLAEVKEQPVWPSDRLTAQVYRAAAEPSRAFGMERRGSAYATALISRELAGQLKPGQKVSLAPQENKNVPREGWVRKIDGVQLSLLGKAEALLEIPDPAGGLAVGDFVEVKVPRGGAPRNLVSIPLAAVLETATGKFAFVKNGSFLLRTEIKTGAKNDEYIEVTEGLYEGDTIAVEPAEALYLIELRATKGGGHSH